MESDSLNIPAFMRKKGLNARLKDKLLNTAYDYKQAGKLAKLAKEVSRTRPLAKAKPARSWPLLDEYEKPIRKIRRKRALKKPQSFEMPLIDINDSGVQEFNEPIMEESRGQIQKKRSGIARIIEIGSVSDYLQRIEVGIIELSDTLREGDIIQIECEGGMFQQPAQSIQINRKQVRMARKGASIGLKLAEVPYMNAKVFKVV